MPVLQASIRLLRMRLRLFANTFKHYSLSRKVAVAISALVIAGVGVLVGVFSWGFVQLVDLPGVRDRLSQAGAGEAFESLIAQLPVLFMTSAFLLGLLANISVLLQTLYLAGDMEFLLAAPIPDRAVFLSKLVQSFTPSVMVLLVLAGPALAGLGYAQHYSAAYYLFIPVFVGLLVASGAGIAAVVVMVLVRVVPPRRAAEAIALAGGLSVFTCMQSGQLLTRLDSSSFSRVDLASLLRLSRPLVGLWNPMAWAGQALSAWGEGSWLAAIAFSAGVFLMAGAVTIASLLAAERLYLSGWARVITNVGRKRSRRGGRSLEAGTPAIRRRLSGRIAGRIPAPVRALVTKDLKLFSRDLRNVSQLILPLIMAVVWGISLGGRGRPEFSTQDRILGGFGIFMAVMMAWGFSVRLGLGAFSLEGRQWWIVKTSPVRRSTLLAAKYLVVVLPSTVLGLLFLVLITFLTGRSWGPAAYDALSLVLIIASLSSLMLSFGVWTARFDWENPKDVQGGGAAGCLVTVVSMISITFLTGLFQGLPVLLDITAGWARVWAYAAGLAAGALFCFALGIVPLVFAAGKVDELGEES